MDVSCQPYITTVLSPGGKKTFGSHSVGSNRTSLNAVANRKFSVFPRNGTLTIDPVLRDYIKLLRHN